MTVSSAAVMGRAPETLSIQERSELAGKWIALEFYSPDTLPMRVIEAIGETPRACADFLRERGLDPAKFEYSMIKPAF